jgi:hypothetical protein
MKRVILAGMVLGAVIVLRVGASADQDPQRPPMFRAQGSAVSVDVAVRDRTRKAIADLTAADFVVEDNGVRQSIDTVSYAKRPIDVTVGLDVSGSVTGLVLDRLRAAVAELARGLRDVDRVKLVLFNTQVQRAIDFSSDVDAVAKPCATCRRAGPRRSSTRWGRRSSPRGIPSAGSSSCSSPTVRTAVV